MQHHSCDFAPVRTLRIRVEQAQIRDDVLLVVSGQYGIGGRGIGDIGIKRRLLHGFSRNRSLIDQLFFWLLGITMTAKPSSSHLTIRDVVRPTPGNERRSNGRSGRLACDLKNAFPLGRRMSHRIIP
jgi:hypothetical protein